MKELNAALNNLQRAIISNKNIKNTTDRFYSICKSYQDNMDLLSTFFSSQRDFFSFSNGKPKILYVKFLLQILYSIKNKDDSEFMINLLTACLEENAITGIIYLDSIERLKEKEIYLNSESILQFCNPNRFTYCNNKFSIKNITDTILELSGMSDGTISNTLLVNIITKLHKK